MEYERVKYIFKSYLRIRLAKIERNLLYLVETDKSNLMSTEEIHLKVNAIHRLKIVVLYLGQNDTVS